jgi:acetylornithine/N-succinyldiaminopimelate aminotransferase
MNSHLMQEDALYVASTYKRYPVEIVSGKGALLTDIDGKNYIDMCSGIAVNGFGACDPEWVAAVTAQLNRIQHTSNLFYTDPCVEVAKILTERTGMKKVFFSNSGAEANECAIKVARKYAAEHLGPQVSTIVTLKNSFHGRTLTTLAATGQDHYHELFQPLTPGFAHVKPGDVEALEQLCDRGDVAAVMIECIQGEGGVIPLSRKFASEVQELVRRRGILLIVDEVQTGNGRTGALYAYMNYGLTPDVVSTAKGLGGGLPLGATLLGEKVQNTFSFGDHGSTFGGNPVCCAGALSILSRLDDAFLAEVREKEQLLREKFSGVPGILEVSGMGLMLGLRTVRPAGEVIEDCRSRGVICIPAKNRVRLLPPLNIPKDLLMQAAQVICECCGEA